MKSAGDFGFEISNENEYNLSQLLRKEKDSLIYEYDFGDGWEHKIILEKVLPHATSLDVPRCTKGKRACPPEDCGGIWGYQDLIEIINDISHPEHKKDDRVILTLSFDGKQINSEWIKLEEYLESNKTDAPDAEK